MHFNVFFQLSIILGVSSLLGYFILRLRLPLIVAYLLTGVLVSLFSITNLRNQEVLTFLPEIGIAFVLFLIGMELDLREIKSLGKPIIISALTQVLISALAGFSIAGFFGFSYLTSIYIGLGLSFSSTVVVIKLLLEKRDITSLYGKLSVGILLIEDLIAIIMLMLISLGGSISSFGLGQGLPLLLLVIKAAAMLSVTFFLSNHFLEGLFRAAAKSVELLFLTALTWCFLFTSISVLLGFSVVIGAFLAGIALASSSYHLQIQGKIKPLRDFFVTLFFVYLGAQVNLFDVLTAWPVILALTCYAICLKPLIYLLLLGMFGFRKHTIFQTAFNLSQISEFSLVILLLGLKIGHVSSLALSAMAIVGVLSIITSSILITYSKRIYKIFSPLLNFFEHQSLVHIVEAKQNFDKEDHVVIIGAHRVGGPVVRYLKREDIPMVVIDFNPRLVEDLHKKGIPAIYGDVSDPDIMQTLQLNTAKLIISTTSDLADTEMLLEECRQARVKAYVVVRALDPEHTQYLKDLGADYVISPENVSGEHLVNLVKNSWL